SAYANVVRAGEALKFSLKSEENIKKQTELENALVKRGAGFSTDVLQAKVQLSGAQARRTRAQGALNIAINAYRTLFHKTPGPIEGMDKLAAPLDRLPTSVDEAVERALKSNSQLIAANLASDIAKAGVAQTRATSYSPTVDGIVDYKIKRDVSAILGNQREIFSKLEMNFPFNLGLTAANTLKASERSFDATVYRYADTKDQITERTRNAWDQFQTASINADLLANQANIAAEFLEFARKERTLGRRSLLDVLNGETAEINARSDTASAETDIIIAAYTLLDVMGELNEAALSGK
ncbi:MAG TPA: outer membrane efflux protein, partial [Rhodospirillales bacterium]|nr:outer membrane efflux protein [Rhodospirillales bacterium]